MGLSDAGHRDLPEIRTEELPDIDWSELQDFFLEHLRGQLDTMGQLLAKGDLLALGRIGHSLKGSGGGVQLPKFTELGRDLEDAGRSGNAAGVARACALIRDEYLVHRPGDLAALREYFAGARTSC